MKKTFLILIISIFSFSVYSQIITEENWVNHQTVKDVRELYLYTENHITSSEFKVYEKTPVYLGDYIINTKVYIDENFGIRKVSYDESENGKFLLTIYYDSNQIIRFAYAYTVTYSTSDYDKDEISEYRIYYDNSGKLVWKAQSEDGNYIALGEKVDIKFFEQILNECPYEIFHQLNNSN